MCGRYTLTQPKKIRPRFDTENEIKDTDPSYNVAPSQYLPTITRNSPNKITMMKWGFIPHWSKDRKFNLINIRSETAKKKPYFKRILKKYRCLVPADGFFEWKKVRIDGKEEKIPYYIYLKNNELFSFAGVYNKLKDAEGKEILTFAILTTKPNPLLKKIHRRMPIILKKKDEEIWLDPKTDTSEIVGLLKPYPTGKMKNYEISKKVNNPKNDSPSLIKPIN